MDSVPMKKIKGVNMKDVHFDEEGYLTKGGLVKEIRNCIRPGHKSFAYQVWTEKYKGKIVSHNYGHGGLGFCVAFGSGKRAIENAESLAGGKLKKDEEITVIGLGVIGLTTALKLHLMGYTNVRLVGRSFGQGNPSFGAAAFITLCFAEVQNNQNFHQMFQIDFAESCREYKRIVDGTHEYLTDGVKLIDYYSNEDYSNEGLRELLTNDVLEEPTKVKLAIDTCDTILEMYHMKSFHVVTNEFMNNLFNVLTKKLKMPLEVKNVKAIEEISSRIVFNCTGVGAKELARDPDVIPVAGHGIILNSEEYGKMDYVLNFNHMESLGITGIDGHMYFAPKNTGFIGGTFVMGDRGKNTLLNRQLSTKLMNNARFVFNGIKPKQEINLEMTPRF